MTDDYIQIRALFDDTLAVAPGGDAHAYGSYFTEDCDYVSYDGTRSEGRGHRPGRTTRSSAAY